MISRKKGIGISMRQISRQEKKAGIMHLLAYSLLEAQALLKESYSYYYHLKQQATLLREL